MEVLTAAGVIEYGHLKAAQITATQVAQYWKDKNMPAPIAFMDIETGPRPLAEIEQFMPTTWPTGNTKDEAKVAAAIAEKKQAWLDDAALSPLTAQVLVIGVLDGQTTSFLEGDEKSLLNDFWSVADAVLAASGSLVGFNCKSFDLPMLIKKSWYHGVRVPPIIRTRWKGRVYFHENIIDLRDEWQMGDKQAHGSLDTIGKLLTGKGKTGSGADFARLYETDKAAALKYLETDLTLCRDIYLKMS